MIAEYTYLTKLKTLSSCNFTSCYRRLFSNWVYTDDSTTYSNDKIEAALKTWKGITSYFAIYSVPADFVQWYKKILL